MTGACFPSVPGTCGRPCLDVIKDAHAEGLLGTPMAEQREPGLRGQSASDDFDNEHRPVRAAVVKVSDRQA